MSPSRTQTGLSHPLTLCAVAVMLLNDFVLRDLVPGLLTGKLSDLAWLVLTPVLLAALLTALGLHPRRARPAALGLVACFYTALQVWPPLGAFIKPDHVADLGDLLALPALLGAIYVWRHPVAHPRVAPFIAGPLVFGALLADKSDVPPDASWPCGDQMTWRTDQPLRLQLGYDTPHDTAAFAAGLRLTDPSGATIPVVVGSVDGDLVICARDGLVPDTTYVWEIGPWDGASSNQVAFSHEGLPTVTFTTSAKPGLPAPNAAACLALATPLTDARYAACDPYADTGDTADTADTAGADE